MNKHLAGRKSPHPLHLLTVKMFAMGVLLSSQTHCRVNREQSLPAPEIMAAFATGGNQFPNSLDQTFLFKDGDPKNPQFGLVEYQVNTPLWTDGAHKRRWILLPPDEVIVQDPGASDRMVYPAGTVLVKHFATQQGEPIETRIIAKKADQKWYFGTYVWEQGLAGPATLSRNPREIVKDGTNYRIPSEKECQLCHNPTISGEPVLGLSGSQLSARATATENQLPRLTSQYLFQSTLSDHLSAAKPIDSPTDPSLSLERRARAYLAVNCSTCHQPGGVAKDKTLDLRLETPLEATNLLTNGRVVPGKAAESLLIKRFTSTVDRMPPLSLRVDPVGKDLLTEWVNTWPGKTTP